ncbi:hypothetical protein Nepgr_005381 [Nepenthes gracilis]|uniref:Uncharacterized protein n=1 Tax=Nepenthes gracilis TaxID=150966 RepID=A0AAD3S3I2_NEPGR|nr:hypothetical protein Nepgr_005381 [Nepenthes gracilis]
MFGDANSGCCVSHRLPDSLNVALSESTLDEAEPKVEAECLASVKDSSSAGFESISHSSPDTDLNNLAHVMKVAPADAHRQLKPNVAEESHIIAADGIGLVDIPPSGPHDVIHDGSNLVPDFDYAWFAFKFGLLLVDLDGLMKVVDADGM